MPISCDNPNARFGFDLYRTVEGDPASEVCFTTEIEMREHVQRLGRAGNFAEICLYRASPNGEWEDEPFEILTPDDFVRAEE